MLGWGCCHSQVQEPTSGSAVQTRREGDSANYAKVLWHFLSLCPCVSMNYIKNAIRIHKQHAPPCQNPIYEHTHSLPECHQLLPNLLATWRKETDSDSSEMSLKPCSAASQWTTAPSPATLLCRPIHSPAQHSLLGMLTSIFLGTLCC